MRGWSMGVVGLYVGLQLFNWVTGLHWLSDVSLPLSIVAGLGLAIASTPLKTTPAPSANASPPQTPEPVVQPPPAPESSISFTIHKNQRP